MVGKEGRALHGTYVLAVYHGQAWSLLVGTACNGTGWNDMLWDGMIPLLLYQILLLQMPFQANALC
jgi:hypothetical protein